MDPSGSLGANQASGQSSQTKDNIGMEPVYYNAAAKIEIGVLKDIPKPLNQLLTPNRNTVLHFYLTSPVKISEDSKSESGEPAQVEVNNIGGMEPKNYNAAVEGKIKVFKDISVDLSHLLTPNRNTILHIYLTSLKESGSKDSKSKDAKSEDSKSSTNFVEEILKKCPELLWQANVKGETPWHIAARYGHDTIVEVLIKFAKRPQQDLESGVKKTVKEMLEMTNNENDTALHEAVRGNHLEVVKRLIGEGKDFSYSRNDASETPLYVAVERNYKDVAFHILNNCTSPAHDGPLGRTTLHAAIIWQDKDMIEKILESITPEERESVFIKRADEQCSTPLHYAAYFSCSSTINRLLEVDRSIAYMKDAKGMTALHIAAHQGDYDIMKELLKYCPDCCELVDKRGWNALHFAVNSTSYCANYAVQVILDKSSLSNLWNEKDAEGNTPLHHHSKSLKYIKALMCNSRVDKMAFNEENLDPYDIALTNEELSDKKFTEIERVFDDINRPDGFRRFLGDDIKSKRKKGPRDLLKERMAKWEAEWEDRKDRFVSGMKDASQIHLVVDTIIATVAFTAGITMPGGFRDHEGPHPGSAVLMRNTAFKAFVITNTIAMVQSCSAAFIHLFMPLLFHDKNPGGFTFLLASLAFCLSLCAMGAMLLAFVTGTYAVLMHSLNLAITNCVIGLCFFIPVLFVSIGCSHYLKEIWSMGISWVSVNVLDFFGTLLEICGYLWSICGDFCVSLCYFSYEALNRYFLLCRRSQRSRNDTDQSTAS